MSEKWHWYPEKSAHGGWQGEWVIQNVWSTSQKGVLSLFKARKGWGVAWHEILS